jgi:hypothetical protein
MALPEGLVRGDLVLVDARDRSGTAAGLYVVDRIPAAGELHHSEVLLLPAVDLALNRQLWAGPQHIIAVYPASSFEPARLRTAYTPPEPPSPTREAAYAARLAAIELEEKVPIGFASDAYFEFTRPDAWGGVAFPVQPVRGIGWVPAADRNRVLIYVLGARELTAPELKEADRQKAEREKEAARR